MRADPDRDGGGDQVAVVPGEPQLDPVGVLGGQRLDHGVEVAERARGEVVALGGVHVEVVERLEVVGRRAAGDLDALLRGLLDVAAPLLVHAGEDVGLRPCAAVAMTERHLEDVLRLAGREPALDRLQPPAEVEQLRHDAGADGVALGGGDVVEAAHGGVGDAGLDGGGVPPAGDHGRAHPHAERTLLPEVRGEGGQPGGEVVGGPVEQRALGQVGEVAPEPGQLPVEHQRGAHLLTAGGTSRATRAATRP